MSFYSSIHPSLKAVCACASLGLVLSAAMPSAYAVIPFELQENTNTNPNTAPTFTGNARSSWVGNGVFDPFGDPGNYPSPGSTPIERTVVDGFTGTGSLTIDPGQFFPTSRMGPNIGVTHTITLVGGGTADLVVANSAPWDDGAYKFNSFGLKNFSGNVTQILWQTTYTQPMAARNDFNVDFAYDNDRTGTEFNAAAIGGGLGVVGDSGTTLAPSDYTVSLTVAGIHSAATPAGPFVNGLPSSAIPLTSNGFTLATGGETTYDAINGFVDYVELSESNEDFLLLRGFDYNHDGTFSSDDAEQVYIEETLWAITPTANGGVFAADSHFVMSMDGQQHSNVTLIPEVSSFLIVFAMGGSVLFGRRRRPTTES